MEGGKKNSCEGAEARRENRFPFCPFVLSRPPKALRASAPPREFTLSPSPLQALCVSSSLRLCVSRPAQSTGTRNVFITGRCCSDAPASSFRAGNGGRDHSRVSNTMPSGKPSPPTTVFTSYGASARFGSTTS